MVAQPPDTKFKKMVSFESLKNCSVNVNNVTNARAIFGPYLPGLRGRLARQKPAGVEPLCMSIPRGIYECPKYVTLMADMMFVNGMAFLASLSRGIRLFTCEHVPSCKTAQLSSSLTGLGLLA